MSPRDERLDRERNRAIEKAGKEIAEAILKGARMVAAAIERDKNGRKETKPRG